jgi:hypothetical protein
MLFLASSGVEVKQIGDCWVRIRYQSGFAYIDGGSSCLQRNPGSPDFKHKVTRKALWIDGWATPAWVKERLKLGTQGKLQFHIGYGARDSQDIAHSNR